MAQQISCFGGSDPDVNVSVLIGKEKELDVCTVWVRQLPTRDRKRRAVPCCHAEYRTYPAGSLELLMSITISIDCHELMWDRQSLTVLHTCSQSIEHVLHSHHTKWVLMHYLVKSMLQCSPAVHISM